MFPIAITSHRAQRFLKLKHDWMLQGPVLISMLRSTALGFAFLRRSRQTMNVLPYNSNRHATTTIGITTKHIHDTSSSCSS
ncbi:hypothetical protein G3M48_000892 [Beauveria asiatica]|uniref:Uncharacterized protein n=1 Tax=Beauveria asiatica TaxID=1069075 RepID=A0AAW0S0A2_9HYPO